ncbi:MAG: sigma-54-dependent Fis family transcriptional regulator, partial [Polyangiaceae bacterium]|nr:sigma-54-dependent Fis family transcriptional regulator [Polyangiaceae bacterium]
FLEVYCRKNQRALMSLERSALEKLMAYDWPGNVRELENAIERAVVLAKSLTITLDDLPDAIARAERSPEVMAFPIGTPLGEIERRVIQDTLRHTSGDKQLTAQLLGISARTIYRKVGADRLD